MKILSKQFNADWKHLFNYKWINTKKVSRNINRTEVVISKSKQKKSKVIWKKHLCGKKLHSTERVKYLVVKTATNLSLHCHEWSFH